MNDFTFYSPTEFVFGRGTETQVGALCQRYGASRVLIVYGGGSAVRSGLVGRVQAALQAAGIAYDTLAGVKPNPTDDLVRQGIEQARKAGTDFLLPVGGGSVIDTAKAIAVGVPYAGDFWDFFAGKAKITTALPLGVVLTIPAAGSEGSGNSVITNTTTQQKLGIKAPMTLRPRFAVMNPELTLTLPPAQTAAGICDMIAHILERYFTNTQGVEVSDRLCEGTITAIVDQARGLMRKPDDYDLRANIMWAGTIAHNGTCGIGREEDWSSHQIEHELSAMFNVTHGAGLAVILPAYMRYMKEKNPARILQFEERVMTVDAFEAFLRDDLQLPVTLRALLPQHTQAEIEAAIPELVRRLHANKGGDFGPYYLLTPADTTQIYKMAL